MTEISMTILNKSNFEINANKKNQIKIIKKIIKKKINCVSDKSHIRSFVKGFHYKSVWNH